MLVSATQRFSLYLLTLLFIWVNAFAAPYHCVSNTHTSQLTDEVVLVGNDPSTENLGFADADLTDHAQYQVPISLGDRGTHSAYPAEETLEEREESHRKDENGLEYSPLPSHLVANSLADIFYPITHRTSNDSYAAVRKQSTYLLDCVFLI